MSLPGIMKDLSASSYIDAPMKYLSRNIRLILLCLPFSGCWLVAAGAGGEIGYIAAQEDRTAEETINDQAITAGVKTRLLADPDVPGTAINVDTFKGVVTLKGFVDSVHKADRAVQIASAVSGVDEVVSKIVIDMD